MWETPGKGLHYLFNGDKEIKRGLLTHLDNWQIEYLDIDKDKDYNEFVYFYKPVRPVIYTYKDAPVMTLNYKHKGITKSSWCEIEIKQKKYRLSLLSISLKLYKTGIGIFALQLENNQYEQMEDILAINSLSKVIYPPVLPLEKAREDYFPDAIKLYLDDKHYLQEAFKEDYKKMPTQIVPFMMALLGKSFASATQKNTKGIKNSLIYIEPIIGSHMFTLCIYRNSWMVENIKNKSIDLEFLNSFILLSHQIQTNLKEGNLGHMAIEYLYGNQCVYGISRYALICISEEKIDSKIYDQLVTLILAQRATLLNFANQLSIISTLPKQELVPAIQNVYEIYIQFINQMYFEEVTEAMQGELIYEKLAIKFKIQKELHQLDFEMEEIHEYASLIEQSHSKFKMDLLTIIGASLVIPTFVTGFFGMNILEETFYEWWRHKEVLLWMNSYALFPILMLLMLFTWGRKLNKRYMFQRLLLLILTLISLTILILYGCGLRA